MPSKATYSAGTAYLTVVPSMLGIEKAMEAQVREMAGKVDKDLSKAMAKGMRDAAKESKGVGKQAGDEFAGAYEREAKKKLVAAYRSLPEPQPGVDLRKWDKSLAKVRSEMKDLSGQRIGSDIDHKTFDTAVDQMRQRLLQLRDTAPASNTRGWFDAAQAEAQLGGLQKFTDEATRRGAEAGDGFGGAFVDRMQKVLRDGRGKIPAIKIDADSSSAERTLAELQGRMDSLLSKRIGIDVDAATAYAELRAIHQELQRLDRRSVRVDIRTNAHEAAAGMGQFIKQAEEAGKSTDKIGRSANFSMSRLGYLIALGASLGTSIVPGAAAAAAAIGAIGTAAVAGASGVGVFALGLSGVPDAVKALSNYENDRAKSANSANQAQRRMAGSTDQVRMAELSLANTRRGISEQSQDAARRVAEAESNVGEVRRQNRRDAVDSARAVQDAQRGVTRAEEDARDVRRQLNDAIQDAVRHMAELDIALGRNKVEQDKAVTAQMEALDALNRLKENPRATETELRRARDSYNEQTQRLKELKLEQKQLTEERARGVQGDDKVIAARKRIADADQRVADARERVDRARDAQQEQAYQATRRLADAQKQVADAQRSQARQQLDAQFQLAQASQAVTSAQRSQQQAWEKTGIAGGEALDNLNWQMKQLSPEAQHFAKFLFGLKGEVLGLRDAAAAPLLPRLEEAITGLMPYVPALSDYIGKVSEKMGDLAVNAVDSLGNPVWRRFFGYVDDTAVPSLQGFYDVGSNMTEGLLSLYLALTPFDRPIGRGLVDMSKDFAKWAENLNRTQGYRDFLDYVRENGPRVVHFLGETGELLIKLVEAAAPLGSLALRGLTLFVDTLNSFPLPVLTAIVFAIGTMSFLLSGLGAVMRAVKMKQQLTDIFGPRMASMVSTYALETGRATEATSRFGKATATVSGVGAATKSRIFDLGQAAFGADSRLGRLAATAGGPVRKGLDGARLAAFNAAIALNGPAGVAGAAVAARDRVFGVGKAADDTSNRANRLRMAAFSAALAFNGPGGLAGGVVAAGTQLKSFGKDAAKSATSGLAAVRRGAGSLVGFLGGPWGVALTAATVVVGGIMQSVMDWKSKTKDMETVLQDLGHTFRDLEGSGKLGGTEASLALRGIVEKNPDMSRAVLTLKDLGLSFDQLSRAAAGSKPDIDATLKVIDEAIDKTGKEWRDKSNGLLTVFSDDARDASGRLATLRQMRQATLDNANALDIEARARQAAIEGSARYQAISRFAASNSVHSNLAIQTMSASFDQNAVKIAALTGLTKAFGDVQATGVQRSDAMRAAIDATTGAATRAIDADETFAEKLIGLRDQVNGAKAAQDAHATSMDLNSATALRNREAVEGAASAAQELYLQDIAANVPMDVATKKHGDRIKALKEEANKLGLTSAETAILIGKYGDIDPSIKTVYDTEGFPKVYNELVRLKFMQDAVAKGWSVTKAEAAWKAQEWWGKGNQGPVFIPEKAQGGPIEGPGTGTSDDVLMWGSNGEWVHQTAAVDYYGPRFMADINERKIPKEILPGYSTGGPVTKGGLPAYAKGGAVEWPFVFDVSKTPMLTLDEALAVIGGTGSLGNGIGGQGWRWQIAELRKKFPGLPLYSGYRANSYTASGGLSWHSRDGGRAVDVPPRADVFSYIHDTWGKNTKELIWGGNPDRNILRGQHHRFDEQLLYQHGPYKGKNGPSPHVHWAFDQGGQLLPGWNMVPNFTGKPEPVLSPSQWSTMEEFIATSVTGGRGETHNHFDFANSTLDEARLNAIQQRQDALNRADRPNW